MGPVTSPGRSDVPPKACSVSPGRSETSPGRSDVPPKISKKSPGRSDVPPKVSKTLNWPVPFFHQPVKGETGNRGQAGFLSLKRTL